jgi:dihydroorotase
MNRLLIRNGRVLLPARGFDQVADVLVEEGKIARIAPKIAPAKGKAAPPSVDATGLWVVPGLVDIHTHLREPGFEYKETIASGTRAAAAGGFTSILCMANTSPVNDTAAVTRFIRRKAQEAGPVRVHPVGAVTLGLAGEALSEMVDLAAAGCVAFSDDGRPVMNAFIMRMALSYLKYPGLPLISHAEDSHLAAGGSVHEGKISCLLGLGGIPASAEETMIARDIILARETGGRLHLAHVSTRGSVELIRAAKAAGDKVTCEVAPHHLFLTDEAVAGFDTATKVNPPLREEADRQALLAALAEGVIDCIACDHAPHGRADKEVEYDRAAFGISGIETSLGLCLKLVHEKLITPLRLVELMSSAPARIMSLPAGDLGEGSPADLALIDPALDWTVDPALFESLGRNTPFAGWSLTGRAVLTLAGGQVAWRHTAAPDLPEPPAD